MPGSVTEVRFWEEQLTRSGSPPALGGWHSHIIPGKACAAVLRHSTPFPFPATEEFVITQMIAPNKGDWKEGRIVSCRGEFTGLEREQVGFDKGIMEMWIEDHPRGHCLTSECSTHTPSLTRIAMPITGQLLGTLKVKLMTFLSLCHPELVVTTTMGLSFLTTMSLCS